MTLVLSEPDALITPEIVSEFMQVTTGHEPSVDAAICELAGERYGIHWLGLWAMCTLASVSNDQVRHMAQKTAVLAGSPLIRDLKEYHFADPATYQLMRWGKFGTIKKFDSSAESLIAKVLQYARKVSHEKPESPEPPAPKRNWIVIGLRSAQVILPFVTRFIPFAGTAYAVIDILLKVFDH